MNDGHEIAKAQEAADNAAAQLLIELAFLVPRGTDFNRHPISAKLVAYKEAVEQRLHAEVARLTTALREAQAEIDRQRQQLVFAAGVVEGFDMLTEEGGESESALHRQWREQRDRAEQLKADLTTVREARVQAERSWLCFHCGERFTDEAEARDHFGPDYDVDPACVIKADEGGLVGEIRRLEAEVLRVCNERNRYENDARLWHEAEADRVRRIGHVQWWQELDYREGEKLVLQERATAAGQALEAERTAHAETKRVRDDAIANHGRVAADYAIDVRRLEATVAQLRTALTELQAHCDDALRVGGQRVRGPLFVPSVAKRVQEIIRPALAEQSLPEMEHQAIKRLRIALSTIAEECRTDGAGDLGRILMLAESALVTKTSRCHTCGDRKRITVSSPTVGITEEVACPTCVGMGPNLLQKKPEDTGQEQP